MCPCLAAQGDWPQGDSPSVKTWDGGAGWKKTDVKHDQMDLKTGGKHCFCDEPQIITVSCNIRNVSDFQGVFYAVGIYPEPRGADIFPRMCKADVLDR